MRPKPIIFFQDLLDGYKVDVKFQLHGGNEPLIVIGIKKNNDPFILNVYNHISRVMRKGFPDV